MKGCSKYTEVRITKCEIKFRKNVHKRSTLKPYIVKGVFAEEEEAFGCSIYPHLNSYISPRHGTSFDFNDCLQRLAWSHRRQLSTNAVWPMRRPTFVSHSSQSQLPGERRSLAQDSIAHSTTRLAGDSRSRRISSSRGHPLLLGDDKRLRKAFQLFFFYNCNDDQQHQCLHATSRCHPEECPIGRYQGHHSGISPGSLHGQRIQ